MIIDPLKNRVKPTSFKSCSTCGGLYSIEDFAFTHSMFYPDNHLPMCNDCVKKHLQSEGWNWEAVDKLCQYAGIPFIVSEWDRLYQQYGDDTWAFYAKVFKEQEYQNLGWDNYYKQYLQLRAAGLIESEIPELQDEYWHKLQVKWGANYSHDELEELEELLKGLQASQNIVGAVQINASLMWCKLSLLANSAIRGADKDLDKILASMEKVIKMGNFTAKNIKNNADFDSWGEFAVWLERRGLLNTFYDGATRDVIDETLKSMEHFNQSLYINESGLGDEITSRKAALALDEDTPEQPVYGIDKQFSREELDNFQDELEERFDAGGEDDGN